MAVEMAHDQEMMRLAIAQSQLALQIDEIPIGCVIEHAPTGRIIASAHNRRHVDRDPTAHAEMLAIREAAAVLGDWRLIDCTLYVTLEPCPMCAGALVNARINRVVWGCDDPKAGAIRTLYQIANDPRLNHRIITTPGVFADECSTMLSDFFRAKRALGKK